MSRWRWGKLNSAAGIAALSNRFAPTRGSGGTEGTKGPHARVYSSARWQTLRARKLRQHPFCAKCGVTNVRLICDHKRELRDGGAAFDEANVEVLCAKCHGKKTQAARRARLGLG
jgi:5-methylcytosine-specific restriction protein A